MGQKAIDGASYARNERGRLEAGFSAEEVRFVVAERSSRNAGA
jgi:hypothetical protein